MNTTIKLEVDRNNNIQQELEIKTTNEDDHQLFRCHWNNECIFYTCCFLSLCAITSIDVYIYFIADHEQYFDRYIMTIVGVTLSVLLCTFVNEKKVSKQKKLLVVFILNVLLNILLLRLMLLNSIETSLFLTIVSGTSAFTVLITLSLYQCLRRQSRKTQQSSAKRKKCAFLYELKGVLMIIYAEQSLIVPVFFHFADIASDIGTSYEYYQRSKSVDATSHNDKIDYNLIFILSVSIFALHKIASSVIIAMIAGRKRDWLLQFCDVFIIKTLNVEWKLGYSKPGRLHGYISLIEAVFESTPQSIISMYIIIAENSSLSGSVIIWISSIFSIVSVARKSVSIDERFFSEESRSKTFGSIGKCICPCTQIPAGPSTKVKGCNCAYFVRVIWRIIDVVSFVLFLALLWHYTDGWVVVILLIAMFLFISWAFWWQWQATHAMDVYILNGILITLPTSWVCPTNMEFYTGLISPIRNTITVIMSGLLIYYHNDDMLVIINFVLIVLDNIIYVFFVGRQGCLSFFEKAMCRFICWDLDCSGRSCPFTKCGKNWVYDSATTSLTISSCKTGQEIRGLMNEGVNIKPHFKSVDTWMYYDGVNELIQLVEEYKIDLKGIKDSIGQTIFACIVRYNMNASNLSKDEMEEITQYFVHDIDVENDYGWTPIQRVCRHQSNIMWLEVMIAYGANVNHENKQSPLPTTAIQNVCRYQSDVQWAKVLIEANADVNISNDDGWSAIHFAAKYQSDSVWIQTLLDSNANIHAKTNDGLTVADIVQQNGTEGKNAMAEFIQSRFS